MLQAPNGAISRLTARHSSNNLCERHFIVKYFLGHLFIDYLL
jgi:hypothetical protein